MVVLFSFSPTPKNQYYLKQLKESLQFETWIIEKLIFKLCLRNWLSRKSLRFADVISLTLTTLVGMAKERLHLVYTHNTFPNPASCLFSGSSFQWPQSRSWMRSKYREGINLSLNQKSPFLNAVTHQHSIISILLQLHLSCLNDPGIVPFHFLFFHPCSVIKTD